MDGGLVMYGWRPASGVGSACGSHNAKVPALSLILSPCLMSLGLILQPQCSHIGYYNPRDDSTLGVGIASDQEETWGERARAVVRKECILWFCQCEASG